MAPPWDDTDWKWFRLDAPRTQVSGTIVLGIEVTPRDRANGGVLVFAGRLEINGKLTLVGQPGPSSGLLSFNWNARRGERFFVAVQRRERAGQPLSFDVVARTNVNILLGGKVSTPRLVCQDETSGWGSDDIALTIESDGITLCSISNDEIRDFDQDDVRDLDQWIPETVIFLDHIGVKVIEEDDIDPDDVGVGRIPPIEALPSAPRIAIDDTSPDGTVRIRLSIDVDDGTYEFRASLASWHEKA